MDDTEDERHVCTGTDGDWVACHDGTVYGPCASENCYGGCEWVGRCDCTCHELEGTR